MPKKKRNELTAGIFVLGSLAIVFGVVLWLGAANAFRTKGQMVSFYAPQEGGSVGILEGSEIHFCDAKIGTVQEVEVQADKNMCIYRAQLWRKDIKIFSDGKAAIVSPPIGMAKVVIKAFGESGVEADDDNPILLAGGLDQAMADITDTIANIKNELDKDNPEAVLAKIHVIIESLQTVAADISGMTSNILPETDKKIEGSILANLDETTVNVRDLTADAKPRMQNILTSVENTTKTIEDYAKNDIAELLVDLRKAGTEVLEISQNFAVVSEEVKEVIVLNRDNVDEILDNMNQVSANLKSTTKEIRRNPWRLIHKPKGEELDSQNIYDAARAFSDGAAELDQTIAKLSKLSQLRPDGIAADDLELQEIKEKLNDTFSKFSKAEQSLWKELSE